MKWLREKIQKLKIRLLKIEAVNKVYQNIKEHLWYYIVCILLGLYIYGLAVNSVINSINNFYNNTSLKTVSFNPIKCFAAVFSPESIGILFFMTIMYFLITGKGLHFITGVKITKDERNFYVSDEGTHGTSGWMNKKEQEKVLRKNSADKLPCPILCKIKNDTSDNYVGLRNDCGLNSHMMIYGASGAGKSRGFVKPFILKTAELKQSMVIVDPKAEFFEQFSVYLKKQGYVVRAFNLLDMENSDGWNCIGETEGDVDMVQSVAEVIIRNTSEEGQKADFWDKAEQNLLLALILYVQSMRDPITNELLPIQERSLGTIYKMLSTEGAKSLDMKFQRLPLDHPARAPYGIFKQAASNLWGNIFIGLGSRLNVFQNKLVDTITKYHDIDMELPGKQPCAYFCIISAQDTAYEFLSSLFFSLMFKKLSDYARKHGNERGRLPVEVNFILDEFCNVGRILDFKKTISVVRSYGMNCYVVVQSIAQLADRYPVKEWEEIVGNCDTQLFLGCNDSMTSEFISKRCGNITIQLTNSMAPQTPLFSPITKEVTGYRQTKSNNTRPLMYPEEVLQLDNKECLLLIRGQKPLKAFKIIPDELSAYKELEYVRVNEYVPEWHKEEPSQADNKINGNPLEFKDFPKPVKVVKEKTREEKQTVKENPDAEHKHIQITLDEAETYYPQNADEFTETDVDDILNE